MAYRFSGSKVAKTLIDCIEESLKEYDPLNETKLSDTPEYFITVNSFKKLSKEFGYNDVTMEWNVEAALNDIKEKSGLKGKKPGRPFSGLRRNGRFDIVLWKEQFPLGVIEIKKDIWTNDKYRSDIERIRAILKLVQHFDKNYKMNAFFSFYLEREDDHVRSNKADIKIRKFLEGMKEHVDEILKDEFDFTIERGKFLRYEGEIKAWGIQAFCFVIHN
jgi:hypothetical protein